MTKNDLIDAVAESSGLKKDQASKAINAVLRVVTDTLSRGESIALTGFGTFMVRDRAARTVRNPVTGGQLNVEKRRVPAFKPGKGLRDSVSPGKGLRNSVSA